MDFGKTQQIEQVTWGLPPDATITAETLAQQNHQEIQSAQVYVGCPVWANKAWRGNLYPPQAKEKEFLNLYAQQFNCIELNVTHYQIPTPNTIAQWQAQTPTTFAFCPKLPQQISHRQLPLGQAQDLTLAFAEAVRPLQNRLGIPFLQLSPQFSLNQLLRLQEFLAIYPQDLPLAVEFRHPSWFIAKQFAHAAELLRSYGKGTVITDVGGRRDVLHMSLTTPIATIRFVGNSLHRTDYERIDDWVKRLREWLENGLQKLYFFVHEPDNTLAPQLALYFIQRLNTGCGLQLQEPNLQQAEEPLQGNLF